MIPSKFMSNYSKEVNCNISLLLRLWMYQKYSNRFFQQITIILPQQKGDILSACLFFHYYCKALDSELWFPSSKCLNHCPGGTAPRSLKLGSYCENAVAKIFSYTFIMTSSLNGCIQMFIDILHQLRVVIYKT